MKDLLSFILSNKDWSYKMGGGRNKQIHAQCAHPPLPFTSYYYPPPGHGNKKPNWRGEKQNSYTIVFQQ